MSCGSVIKALDLRWMCLLLLSPALSTASTDSFSVVAPTEPVSGLYGSSVVLPCYLSDNKDASSLRVRWHRSKSFNNPVLIYNDKVLESEMDQLYQGRVYLYGDLKTGIVSLRLQNLTTADAGLYVCRVSSETWYNTANVSLKVTAVGFTPVLYLTEAEEGKVNITCQSHGWLPEPAVIWTNSDGKKVEHLHSEKFFKDSHGLITVTSSLITSPSESAWFSCSVGFMYQEMKDSRISSHIESGASWFGSFITALVFLLLLLCIALICGFYLLKRKGLLNRKRRNTAGEVASPEELQMLNLEAPTVLNQSDDTEKKKPSPSFSSPQTVNCIKSSSPGWLNRQNTAGEVASPGEPQLPDPESPTNLNQSEVPAAGRPPKAPSDDDAPTKTVDSEQSSSAEKKKPSSSSSSPQTVDCTKSSSPDWNQLEKQRVTITVNKKGETSEFLKIAQDGRRIYFKLEDVKPDKKIFILCQQMFSSGKYYFKVTVQQNNKVKSSWYVGVASEAEKTYNIPLTPENDFWVLCYEKDRGVYIENQTDMVLSAEPASKINDVGVIVDCDNNTVSFYNAFTKSHIYTFSDVKNTKLRPLISPGTSDTLPVVLN